MPNAPTPRSFAQTPRRPRPLAWLLVGALTLSVAAAAAIAQEEGVAVITFLSVAAGAPGTSVELGGLGFGLVHTVRVGPVPATILALNETSIRFAIPQMPPGTNHISISGPDLQATVCCFDVTTVAPEALHESPPTCALAGYNMHCGSLGSIRMAFYHDVHGAPIRVVTEVLLTRAFDDRDTRWIMFSLRNVTAPNPSPVTIHVEGLATEHGPVETTQLDQETPHHWTAWVDVLDTPIGVPIRIAADIGSTERGAYRLEALVMPFDRFYQPSLDERGAAAHLYTFTLLGVNEATASTYQPDGGSLLQGNKTPTLGLAAIALGILGGLAASRRGRQT